MCVRIAPGAPSIIVSVRLVGDGCRISNWTHHRVPGRLKRYEYPRYVFTDKSTDILGLCAEALARLDIAFTRPRTDTISVARRSAVAALDLHVGAKS